MSHDTGYSGSDDRVVVQLSTDGGTSFADLGSVSRYDAACSPACWNEHVFDLSPFMGEGNVVVGFLGISEYGNNIFVDDVNIRGLDPDLSTSTKSAPGAVPPGDEITYIIDIINSWSAPASAATLVDPLPTDTTCVPMSVTCSSGICLHNDALERIEWSGTVPAAGTVTVTFVVDTGAVPCGVVVTNTAVIDDPDMTGGPVTVVATTRVAETQAAVDESFTGTTFPPGGWSEELVIDPGTDPDWSRVTSGTSPNIAPYTDPAMAKFNSYDTQATASARLSTPSFDVTGFTMPTLSFWMSHDLGYSSATDLIQPQVSTDGGMSWVDLGTPVLRYDPSCSPACWLKHSFDMAAYIGVTGVRIGLLAVCDDGNNLFVDDVVVAEPWYPCSPPSADLSVVKDDGAVQVAPGDPVTYTITVTNLGPSPVVGASVVDSFPDALVNARWTCLGTGGAGCTGGPVSGDINDPADIPDGDSVVYTVTGNVGAAAAAVMVKGRSSLVNTANVYPPPGVPDPDLANNSSTDIDEIVNLADVAIVKDDGEPESIAGMPVTYFITVVNNGPDDVVGAVVTDAFPETITGVTWNCVGAGGGVCAPAGAGALLDVATLPNGSSVVYTATGILSADATGTVDNTATVTATGAIDPVPQNNSSTDTNTIALLVFYDGFESGNTSAWSSVQP
jgi:uncharacterized repeat protein (TIGR01451 family)